MPLGVKEMSHWIEAHGQESGRAGRSALSLRGNPAGAPRPIRLRVSRRSGRGQGPKSAVVQTEVADRGFAEDTPLAAIDHLPRPESYLRTGSVLNTWLLGSGTGRRTVLGAASGSHPGRVRAVSMHRA
jgi:hypothetical protein